MMKVDPEPNDKKLTATGRVPGRKGMATRARLLEEVERRCVSTPYRDITVTEVARAADTSPATFYHYFPDVAAAAAEVAAEHLAEFDGVLDRARAVVVSDGDLAACHELVHTFVTFWDGRPALLNAVDVSSADEDPRFFRILYRAFRALTDILAEGVKVGHPVGVSGTLVMMLSHTAAREGAFAVSGVTRQQLVESMALVMHATLRGPDQMGPSESSA